MMMMIKLSWEGGNSLGLVVIRVHLAPGSLCILHPGVCSSDPYAQYPTMLSRAGYPL